MARLRHFAAWRWIGGALALVVAVWIVVHAALVASQTEGGWQMLRDHLTAGIPGVLHPADYREDEPQTREAKWLLAQGQQVLNDPHATAAECMGAAQVHSSIYGWREIPNPISLGVAMWWPLPHPAIQLGPRTDLIARRLEQARLLADKAIQLEPNCADWWRLKVLARFGWLYNEPGDESLLRQAAVHDPDNALYDYLLAANRFERAWGANSDGELFIAHPESLLDSKNFYLHAIAKPLLATGEVGSASAAKFFERAEGSLALKLGCYSPHDFDYARSSLFYRFESPFDGPKFDELSTHRLQYPAANWFLSQNLALDWLKQWKQSGESLGEAMAERLSTMPTVSGNLSPEERQQMLGFTLWRKNQFEVRRREELSKFGSVVAVAASSAACMLLLVALGCWIAGLISKSRANRDHLDKRNSKSPSLGILLPALVWLAIFAFTYGLLGLLPAFKPRLADCHWAVWAAIAAATFALVGGLLWVSIRFIWTQGRLPRDVRAPHYQFVRWGLVLAVSMVFVVVMQSLVDRHIRRWSMAMLKEFPAHVINEIDNMALPNDGIAWLSGQVGVANQSLPWSLVQWGIHGGLWFTTAAWLLAMFFFQWNRQDKLAATARVSAAANRQSDGRRMEIEQPRGVITVPRTSWRACWRPIGKSALVLALIFLLVSIAATTDWLVRMRTQYEQKLARLANAKWMAEEFETVLKAEGPALELSSGK